MWASRTGRLTTFGARALGTATPSTGNTGAVWKPYHDPLQHGLGGASADTATTGGKDPAALQSESQEGLPVSTDFETAMEAAELSKHHDQDQGVWEAAKDAAARMGEGFVSVADASVQKATEGVDAARDAAAKVGEGWRAGKQKAAEAGQGWEAAKAGGRDSEGQYSQTGAGHDADTRTGTGSEHWPPPGGANQRGPSCYGDEPGDVNLG